MCKESEGVADVPIDVRRRRSKSGEVWRSAEKCGDDRKEIGRKSTRYSESLIEI